MTFSVPILLMSGEVWRLSGFKLNNAHKFELSSFPSCKSE